MTTAILFIIFNRPDTTKQVFEAIRKAQPSRLYIAADGPREGRVGEVERVAKVREIATAIDWPCDVKTLFQEQNLGCKYGPKSAIDWFFHQEEEGIILEDDCLPHPDFFGFCEDLLLRYRTDERVAVITGNNFQNGQRRGEASYYFSRYVHIWGWATWRRAWLLNDSDIRFWPHWRDSEDWKGKLTDKVEARYWRKIFDSVYEHRFETTWDYPWTACAWYHGRLTATPNGNLVSNIGFGPDSTHTKDANSPIAAYPTNPLGKLIHPELVVIDDQADRYVFHHVYGGKEQRFPGILYHFPRKVLAYMLRHLKKILNTTQTN